MEYCNKNTTNERAELVGTENDSHQLLYSQIQLPVFQNKTYLNSDMAVSCPKGDLTLIEDLNTGLIYNSSFKEELMNYDETYQNEQGLSSVFKLHLNEVAGIISRSMGQQNLIEVGCGKGFFLETLLERGFGITGFDPTYQGNNPLIFKSYFNPESGMQAEGLILRHVLEHIKNPIEFLFQLCKSCQGRGKIYIEVPCFEWICKKRAFFDIFYEHVNYFRLSDFFRIFSNVLEAGHCFGGQYIYVVADLSSLRNPIRDNSPPTIFPNNFLSSIEAMATNAADQIIIWGGSSKGVIFSLLLSRAGINVSAVIDINPAKQGRYLPGTGIIVISPAEALARFEAGTKIYVMNSNYIEEIRGLSLNKFNYLKIDDE